jgi:hypothetical protein
MKRIFITLLLLCASMSCWAEGTQNPRFLLGMPVVTFLTVMGTQLIWIAIAVYVVIKHAIENKQKGLSRSN